MVIRLGNRTTSQCTHIHTQMPPIIYIIIIYVRAEKKNTQLNHHKTYRSRWLQPAIIYKCPIFIYNIVILKTFLQVN